MSISEQDIVHVNAGGKAGRPGVVLRLQGTRAFVIFGTGNDHQGGGHVLVRQSSRYGRPFPLTKDTYFYCRNVQLFDLSLLAPNGRQCPPGLYLDLRTLVGYTSPAAATAATPAPGPVKATPTPPPVSSPAPPPTSVVTPIASGSAANHSLAANGTGESNGDG